MSGSEIALDKIPSQTQLIGPAQFSHERASSVAEALEQAAPAVSLTDVTGNPFQPQVDFRGFVASPVLGTPQGLAVYQNGVRINEVFGDTVNWDFIPERAIRRMILASNNPVFGLNATGGAISIDMKNGFEFRGTESDIWGGSFGRRGASAESGRQAGGLSMYIATDALNDNGWRDLESWSRLRRMYADVGTRGESGELHVNFTGAANRFGNVGPTPIELLQRRWSSVYTTPQTTDNQLAFWTANGRYEVSDATALQGNLYYRAFRQKHVDGNVTEAERCYPLAPNLCFDDPTTPLTSTNGLPVPDIFGDATLGQIDRTRTQADSWGGSVQATDKRDIFGFGNNFLVGASRDNGRVRFGANSELGTIGPDLVVTGAGIFIDQPDGEVGPVQVRANTAYTGFYFRDTLDLTSRLSVTVGGRFNMAQIRLQDELGTDLTGSHQYERFNPMLGATYKLLPGLSAYAGYSEANRAPTPVELACANPERPCLLDAFLVADPDLKQVVSYTREVGLRGELTDGRNRLAGSVGLFRTDSSDDIINVASPIAGRGYFQNAGTTRREGIEAAADLTLDRWEVRAGFAYVDATFRSALALPSPFNPAAVDGLIQVAPGDVIPAIPNFRYKLAVDYRATDKWKIGGEVIAIGSQYLVGDESNQYWKVPAYEFVNLRTSYQLTDKIEMFGRIQNLFDQRYFTYGRFFDTQAIPFLGLTDPRTLSPSAPLAVYAGLRGKL